MYVMHVIYLFIFFIFFLSFFYSAMALDRCQIFVYAHYLVN